MRTVLRTLVLTTAALLGGIAHADAIESPVGLKRGEALPAGQAALLMVIDRGTRHSSMKNPEQAYFVIVAVATGTPYRLSDVDDATVRIVPPGKYYLKDAYSQTRAMEIMGIHDPSDAFEVKADVLNYVGAWKFSNQNTKTTGALGLEIAYAAKPLERALTDHPAFVAAGKVFLNAPGKPSTPLGGN